MIVTAPIGHSCSYWPTDGSRPVVFGFFLSGMASEHVDPHGQHQLLGTWVPEQSGGHSDLGVTQRLEGNIHKVENPLFELISRVLYILLATVMPYL